MNLLLAVECWMPAKPDLTWKTTDKQTESHEMSQEFHLAKTQKFKLTLNGAITCKRNKQQQHMDTV